MPRYVRRICSRDCLKSHTDSRRQARRGRERQSGRAHPKNKEHTTPQTTEERALSPLPKRGIVKATLLLPLFPRSDDCTRALLNSTMPCAKKDKSKITPFQSRVYETISGIPAGKISTYGGVAKALNSSARAVGGALRGNPFAPVVPCHRVVMSDLTIGGFSGSFGDCADTRRKRKMLEDEGVRFTNDKVSGNAFVHVFSSLPAGGDKKTPSSGKRKRKAPSTEEEGLN